VRILLGAVTSQAKKNESDLSLRIVLHRRIPEDPELHRQWNALALQTERPQVFYTGEWALAMQTAYAASLKPLLFLGYDGDELVGVASLATDPAERKISFLASTTADYCDFLAQAHRRDQFLNVVLEEIRMRQPDELVLANLPADSVTAASLQGAAKGHGFHMFQRPAYRCAQVDLGNGEQRNELKTAVTRKKKLRALERAGEIKIAHLRSWASIRPALHGFADAHAARFRLTGRVSSLATSERRHFLEDLARRFSDSGVVTLTILTVNDKPVAWNYGFQFGGSWFWYQPTFDTGWQNFSPGYCLLAKIIIEACDADGMRVVDLGLGDEGYKERFGNTARRTLYVTMTQSRVSHLQEIARYRAASLLKESPRIETAVRRILGQRRPTPLEPSGAESLNAAVSHLAD
jgi:CelD/BcsL family acetyltransferase involved in cellulose biosynthesis